MDQKNSRYYLNLPYPENLIRTVCQDDGEITEDRILGLKYGLEHLPDRQRSVADARFRERKTFPQIAESLGISTEMAYRIYKAVIRKFRAPYRYDLILLGYEGSQIAKEKAEEAERKADEEAYADVVEAIGRPELMTMSVKKLDLPVRIMNRFAACGIKTIMDLWIISQRHPKDYDRMGGIGEIGKKEIADRLKELGFDL